VIRAHHVKGCHVTQETKFYNVEDDVGLMHSANHVVGCHITQEMRVQNAFDDMASTIQGLMDIAHHVIEYRLTK